MKIEVEGKVTWCDRDGARKDHGAQGLSVYVDGVEIHFDDERNAVILAEAILERMGVSAKSPRIGTNSQKGVPNHKEIGTDSQKGEVGTPPVLGSFPREDRPARA